MAGHSHATNVKWRKDRQSQARGKLHQKIRRDIELLIREEGKLSEKALNIARQNNFPKEKVYQIWEKVKLDKKNGCSQYFYQAPFGIWLCFENDGVPDKLAARLKLKEMPLHLLFNYFQLIYILKLAGESSLLTECLLTDLPTEIWEKIDYDEQKQELISTEKEVINTVKNIISIKNPKVSIVEEKSFWKAFFPRPLSNPEEENYYSQLKKELTNIKFYSNVEKWE